RFGDISGCRTTLAGDLGGAIGEILRKGRIGTCTCCDGGGSGGAWAGGASTVGVDTTGFSVLRCAPAPDTSEDPDRSCRFNRVCIRADGSPALLGKAAP
ncbi:unnamed protein product, partial [Rotaria magnacalcarata]